MPDARSSIRTASARTTSSTSSGAYCASLLRSATNASSPTCAGLCLGDSTCHRPCNRPNGLEARSAQAEDLAEGLAETGEEDVGVGDGGGVDVDADAARAAVREQSDIGARTRQRAERVDPLDLRAAEVERERHAGHVARDEIGAFEHRPHERR